MRKINEIFYSLQGEGHHEGYPSVFIRFSGCNLSCPFCDTKHDKGIFMDDDAIIHAVKLYKADWIVLTGGEPALSIDADFIHLLRRATGKKIAIETNGTHALPAGIDWVTLSPKQGFEGGDAHPVVLDRCDELKVVYLGQDLSQYQGIAATHRYLQPCYVPDERQCQRNMQACVEAVLAHPEWRLSLQVHRVLHIR